MNSGVFFLNWREYALGRSLAEILTGTAGVWCKNKVRMT